MIQKSMSLKYEPASEQGRYLIVALNLQLFLYMKTFQRW